MNRDAANTQAAQAKKAKATGKTVLTMRERNAREVDRWPQWMKGGEGRSPVSSDVLPDPPPEEFDSPLQGAL
jgi:hypothetical protein